MPIAIVENRDKGSLFVSMPRYKSNERGEDSSAYVDMLESKLDRMTNELVQMRKELQEMHNKASEIVKAVKQKGKEALNKVSEFFGVKKKMESIRENVREGIIETEQTHILSIDRLGRNYEEIQKQWRVLTNRNRD